MRTFIALLGWASLLVMNMGCAETLAPQLEPTVKRAHGMTCYIYETDSVCVKDPELLASK